MPEIKADEPEEQANAASHAQGLGEEPGAPDADSAHRDEDVRAQHEVEHRGRSPYDEMAHVPHPLGDLLTGTLTIYFRGQQVVRNVPQSTAFAVLQMIDGERSSDDVRWFDSGWLQFKSRAVLATEYDADEDLGWHMSPEDRAALRRNGHPHGFLRTVVEHWRRKQTPEPRYSIAALTILRDHALTQRVDSTFYTLVDVVEGDEGAQLVRSVFRRAEGDPLKPPRSMGEKTNIDDDSVEPEGGLPTEPERSEGPSANETASAHESSDPKN